MTRESAGKRAASLCALLLLSLGSPVSASSDPELRIERNARKRTLTLQVGPVSLPANLGYGAPFVPIAVGGVLDLNGWLRAFETELVDGEGRTISVNLLHHAGLLAPRERDVFNPVMRRIVAFGMETARIQLPGQLGYRVEPGDSILLVGGFFNPTDQPFDEVYLRLHVVYADSRHDARYESVLPLYLDAVPSGQSTFDVPPGETRQSWDWRPVIAGRILALGGHMHENGVSVELEDVTTGELLFVGNAEYDDTGALIGVSRKIFARGPRISPDHVYRVTATYRNPANEVVTGAMGHIGGLFLPDAIANMPPADTHHPAYVADLYANPDGSGAGHDHGGHGGH